MTGPTSETAASDEDDLIARLVARGEATVPIPLDRPIEPRRVTGSRSASEVLAEDRGSS